jgi:hypothetical protein
MLVNQALVQGRGVAWGERALAQKEALSQGVKIHTVLALPPPVTILPFIGLFLPF